MSSSDSDTASFAFSVRNYLKDLRETQVMERGGGAPPGDSRIKLCSYCGKWFESNKALYGHLRVHSVTPARSKTGPKRETESSDEEDEGFDCLVCSESFTSMQLLCRHMGIHRGTVSSGVQQPPATSQESNKVSLSETLELGIGSTVFSGKIGLKRIAPDGDNILDAPPLQFFCNGPAEPERPPMLMKKKKKTTEESMSYQDTSTEGVTASDSTGEKNLETQNVYGSGHGGRSMKNAAAKGEKNLHRCEICGKIFATGQALGGHKTFHRKGKLVQQIKTEQEQCGEVKEYVTRMLLPDLLSEKVSLPEQAPLPDQAPPREMLDFDLNIPYQE